MKIFLSLVAVGLITFSFKLCEAIDNWHKTIKDAEDEK